MPASEVNHAETWKAVIRHYLRIRRWEFNEVRPMVFSPGFKVDIRRTPGQIGRERLRIPYAPLYGTSEIVQHVKGALRGGEAELDGLPPSLLRAPHAPKTNALVTNWPGKNPHLDWHPTTGVYLFRGHSEAQLRCTSRARCPLRLGYRENRPDMYP